MEVDESSFLSRNLLSTTIVSASCFVVLAVYQYYKNAFSYWSKRNISGPRPYPLVGNLLTTLRSDRMKLEVEWRNKFGKLYGTYQGTIPRLIVADAELIHQICVRDFDSFQNHEVSEFTNDLQGGFLFSLQGEHWKRVRAFTSPTFTSGKIKRMFKFLDGCADDLVECFREQLPESSGDRSAIINVKDLYSLFTMDAISTCCYGLKLHREGSKDLKSAATRNDFVKDAMRIFEFRIARLIAILTVPKPILRLFKVRAFPMSSFKPLMYKVQKLIDARRKTAKKFDDYLQLLIDAKIDDQMELNEIDEEENHHAGLTKESLLADQDKMVQEVKSQTSGKLALTDLEILSSGIFLLAVGLETTSTLLSTVTYALAFHQDIQQKLYEELLKIVEYNEDKSKCSFNYEALTSCRYLDSVLSESLRKLAPIIITDRVANRDYRIEKYNLDVPEGSKFYLSLYSVMNDPDYWQEPEKFDPERFMPGNKEKIVPGSYCPFGIGPRHCVGMRFSLTEAKLGLAKIVINFKFEPAPNTNFPPSLARSSGLTKLKSPLIKLLPRTSPA